MGKKSSPPPAPDYTAAAERQSQASREIATDQTYANRPDVTTPYGRQTWGTTQDIDMATGKPVTRWHQNTELDPSLQRSLDSQLNVQTGRSQQAESMLAGMRNQYNTPFSFSGLTDIPNLPGVPQGQQLQRSLNTSGMPDMPGSAEATRNRAENAIYDRQVRRLDPQFAREGAALDTRLANQGIARGQGERGSTAYQNAQSDFNNRREDAYSRAMIEAIQGGGQEASRDYAMDMQSRQQGFNEALGSGNFANAAGVSQANIDNQGFAQGMNRSDASMRQRQQQIAEQLQQRGHSLNEINALLSGQQVGMPQMPSFMGAQAGQAPNYLGAAGSQYGASMDAFNIGQAQQSSLQNGLFGLGRSLMSFGFG